MVNTANFLDFEKPLVELEKKIDELTAAAAAGTGANVRDEISKLRAKSNKALADLYANLDPWKKTKVARHPDRPHYVDYVRSLVKDFVPLAGDRNFADDEAIMGGLGRFKGRNCVIIGHEKGKTTDERLKHNFGMARPEGYRKAIRLMDMAEKFGLPVISLVDTAGAYPGLDAEERGQAEAIARSTERCLTLGVPMVAVITGEGGSGGAVAIASANSVLMLENSIYSVISPEGAASILYRSNDKAKDAAIGMKITAQDLKGLGVIDEIIPEPLGGAHRHSDAVIKSVGEAVDKALKAFDGMDAAAIKAHRRERFLKIGRSLQA
ncbi:acetyl-CoA carboxylase carboxyltransferase subunit alpha [Pseudaquidulcibacter saccharophilus]|uniref:acetyl-CoA carboxylase carboxyltransferase subunit alpha n=1 Tax=Pseudaquidulcibacter saccharophilus TaxID=2831900 RepID=UPI001EFF1ED1|nr:acetyl-CoA carboxylase carboxyltransferase subunit alpha [Pseudaquidulcibacter saccharophilus]